MPPMTGPRLGAVFGLGRFSNPVGSGVEASTSLPREHCADVSPPRVRWRYVGDDHDAQCDRACATLDMNKNRSLESFDAAEGPTRAPGTLQHPQDQQRRVRPLQGEADAGDEVDGEDE